MPDFFQPGNDGMLPEGFSPWRWCVAFTVRPAFLQPLAGGREYRIVVRIVRSTPKDGRSVDYAALYGRAKAIADGRIAQLKCAEANRYAHARILAHGWFSFEGKGIASAFLTLGIVGLQKGELPPVGEREPTSDELASAGGMTPENFKAPPPALIDEIYTDADVRDASTPDHGIFLFSYGEYVPSTAGLDYAPFVQRAEYLTHFHFPFLIGSQSPMEIIRREWFCATNPDIAVVHVYIRLKTQPLQPPLDGCI